MAAMMFRPSVILISLLTLIQPALSVTMTPYYTTRAQPAVPDEDDKKLQRLYDEYNLPYGILGAISHIILIYILGCHFFGRRPLLPWKYLEYHLYNVCATFVMSVVTITLAALLVSRVKESSALVTLLVTHIVFGIVMDGVNIHRYFQKDRQGLFPSLSVWLVILCVVSLASSQMVAQMTDSRRLNGRWDVLTIILAVMAVGGGIIAVIAFFLIFKSSSEKKTNVSLSVFVIAGLASCLAWFLVGDYGAAIVTGNTMGQPRQREALYWVYFVFQYVPIFTL